jgi:hypothetical protein
MILASQELPGGETKQYRHHYDHHQDGGPVSPYSLVKLRLGHSEWDGRQAS